MTTATRTGRRRSHAALDDRLFPGAKVVSYILAVVFALACVIPLLYMISLAFQSDAEVQGGRAVLFPAVPQWGNIARVFEAAPFGLFLLNSLIVAGLITIAHLVFDPMVGYVFAKFEFPGKRAIFTTILATMMIPFFVRMLPLYVMFSNLGWLNTYQGLVVPFLMDAFGIFLMRQYMVSVPNELGEAARVDGASEWRIYWNIVLPQTKPALAVLGLFSFVFQMNEFIWPLIATSTEQMRVITIALPLFNKESFTQWNLTAMASLLLFIPICALFLFTQKYVVRGIAMSGIK
ncbi:carbohydrate ABC transporter permease [Rathayibacter sp. CAU 1779]